jgi:hypothetical protein
MQAHICYKERLLTFQYEGITVHKKLGPLPGSESETSQDRRVDRLTLSARAEMIVRLPVNVKSRLREGLVEKSEILMGVYLADSLVRINNGHIITSVLNTREQEVEIPNPEVQVIELENGNREEAAVIDLTEQDKDRGDQNLSRGERAVGRLRTDHLNDEERKSLLELCFDCQDVFYLPGDKLSSTHAVRHTIPLEPGVTPINT